MTPIPAPHRSRPVPADRPRRARGRRTALLRAVHELLSRRDDVELEFVRHRRRGYVHVAVPRDPDTRQEVTDWDDLSAEEQFEGVLGIIRRPVPTLCGRTQRVFLDGVTGDHELVDVFDDVDLCPSCRRALGEHAPRAFEHPTTSSEDVW